MPNTERKLAEIMAKPLEERTMDEIAFVLMHTPKTGGGVGFIQTGPVKESNIDFGPGDRDEVCTNQFGMDDNEYRSEMASWKRDRG